MGRRDRDVLVLVEDREGDFLEWCSGRFVAVGIPYRSWPEALPIDEAIGLARTLAGRVLVRLDAPDFDWDASEHGAGGRAWPPDDLDLRPRWSYEPADSRRFTSWRVQYTLFGIGITEGDARAALAAHPEPLQITNVQQPADRPNRVIAECVVTPAVGRWAIALDVVVAALRAHIPRRRDGFARPGGHATVLGPSIPDGDAGPPIAEWGEEMDPNDWLR